MRAQLERQPLLCSPPSTRAVFFGKRNRRGHWAWADRGGFAPVATESGIQLVGCGPDVIASRHRVKVVLSDALICATDSTRARLHAMNGRFLLCCVGRDQAPVTVTLVNHLECAACPERRSIPMIHFAAILE